MNESDFEMGLKHAFGVEPMGQDQMSAVARVVRLRSAHRRTKRRLFFALSFVTLTSILAGFTYPVASANLFGMEVHSRMQEAGPYSVRISLGPGDKKGAAHWSNPWDVLVDGNEEFIMNPVPGSTSYLKLDAGHPLMQVRTASHRVVQHEKSAGLDAFVRMPLTVMDRLGKFDFAKRIESQSVKQAGGRQVKEVVLRIPGAAGVFPIAGKFTLDIDVFSGLPITMVSDLIRFEYRYDSKSIRAQIAGFRHQMRDYQVVNLEQDRPKVSASIYSKPLADVPTGRDHLKILKVEQNDEGDVFVLYSCKGYHSDENREGDWLQLDDETGQRWLSDIIDMSFCKLALLGEGLKAQAFFSPRRSKSLRSARLSIRLDEWEYQSSQEPTERTNRTLELGAFQPERVLGSPIWMIYAFNVEEESWLRATAKVHRFHDALHRKDFNSAVLIGNELMANFPETMTGIFFEMKDLDHELGVAYRGLGDKKKAVQFDMKARQLGWSPSSMPVGQ